MIVLMSFIAVFPLMFQQLETSHRRTTSIYAWSKIQAAAESGLQRAMYGAANIETTHSFFYSSSTYPLASDVELVVWTSASWTTGTPRYVYSYATTSIRAGGVVGDEQAGFDPLRIEATYDPVTNQLSDWNASR